MVTDNNRPVCKCHNAPMQPNGRRKDGSRMWRCMVRERESRVRRGMRHRGNYGAWFVPSVIVTRVRENIDV